MNETGALEGRRTRLVVAGNRHSENGIWSISVLRPFGARLCSVTLTGGFTAG